MTPATNWMPGVIVLLVALAIGVVVLLQTRRGPALPAAERSRRDELERQKDALYTLLREHAAVRPTGDDDAWLSERHRLEHEAARVLRDIDALGSAPVSTSAAPSFGQRNPQLVGAMWGAGAMLFVGALALTLQEFAKPRAEGGSMTGNSAGMEGGDGSAQVQLSPERQAQLVSLQAAVDATPNDVNARNQLGHALLHAGKLMDSYKQAEAVVAITPDDPEARTHQAIVLIAIGDVTTAASALDKILARAPDFAEALAYRGALYFQAGDGPNAISTLERAMVADPGLASSVGPLIEAAKAGKMPAASAGSDASGPVASGGPMSGAQASGTGPMSGAGGEAQAGPSAQDVTGTITVAPAIADKVKPGDTLFLSARPPGVDRGPPTWVMRLSVTTFPLEFRIGPANAMLGGAPPPELVLTARIDRDGNAMSKGPDDLEGKSATLTPGATGVTITLGAP